MAFSFVRLFIPDRCIVCGDVTVLNVPLCKDCLGDFCELFQNKCPVCQRTRHNCVCGGEFAKSGRFLFYYHTPVSKKVISVIKHNLDNNLADFIAELIYMSLKESKKFDCIVYPPRAKQSIKKYGFDQAGEIALSLGAKSGVKVIDAIKRKRKTAEQKLLSATQRRKNVMGMFESDKEKLSGKKRVLLIDDVYTTGATVKACEAALRKAGVKVVIPFTVAFTPVTRKAKPSRVIMSTAASGRYKVKRK
ncbi:MAG: ComF family protein [Clostridiales bacterium]|jgi:ComF family protein|nr:ComF family protein [Clostridiales bacterium]